MDINLLSKHEMAKLLGIHPETLKEYRKELIEGVHYFKPNSRVIRYNRDLLLHWFANRKNPDVHQKVIALYLASLPENQPLKRGRKPSSSCA